MPPKPKLSDTKRTSLKYVGRDEFGKTIPHKYSKATAQRVAMLVSAGYNEEDIAFALNVRPGLIRQHYPKELEAGSAMADMPVVQAAYMQACAGEPQMTKFWLKSRRGWRDGDSAKTGDDAVLNIHIHT